MKLIEAVERLRRENSRDPEEARTQAIKEALETGKPVLMEEEGGRFRRKTTVFDLRTKTHRLFHRLLH